MKNLILTMIGYLFALPVFAESPDDLPCVKKLKAQLQPEIRYSSCTRRIDDEPTHQGKKGSLSLNDIFSTGEFAVIFIDGTLADALVLKGWRYPDKVKVSCDADGAVLSSIGDIREDRLLATESALTFHSIDRQALVETKVEIICR